MKRLFARMVAALLAAILFFPIQVSANSAEKAVLMDAQTGRVLYEKNANSKALIASTTKIMTAIIVAEQTNVLDRFMIPREAVGIEGSSLYLQEGEILTIQDLLYGLMLHSGNDAAVALAIYCAGTVEGFVELMNDKAHRLGLKNTHFDNPHGLDSRDHYSTAYDMAVLTAYAMKNPIFHKTVSTKSCKIGNRSLRNHNKLLWLLDGADGVKTGFTKASGRVLVSSAVQNGRRLICVTINDPNDWKDHASLHTMGFSQFSLAEILRKDSYMGCVSVSGGSAERVNLYSSDDFSYSISSNENVAIVLQPISFVYAPVTYGEHAGFAYILVDNRVIGKVPLYYGETVEQAEGNKVPLIRRLLGGKQ